MRIKSQGLGRGLSSLSCSIQTGPFGSQLPANLYTSEGVPVINPSHIVDGFIQPDHTVAISEETAKKVGRHRFEADDIVIARRGEIGRCAVVRQNHVGWICGTGSIKLRLHREMMLPDYCALLFSDSRVRAALRCSSIGATMDNLNEGMIGRLRLPTPATQEQADILDAVAKSDSWVGSLIGRAEREIDLISEYRTRLIADVVTGKLDVLAAAANLPEISELESIVEAANVEELDEAVEDHENAEAA